MTQENKPVMTAKELFKKLVDIHTEVLALNDVAKAMKDDLKEAGSELNFSEINAVAKKAAAFKTEEAKAKAAAFIEMIEELT
jgi:transcriptional/translational regulatory protein YebC/TACO1